MARRLALAAVLAPVLVLAALSAQATTLLRDADLEHSLKEIAAPILRAAGLSPTRVKLLVVDDNTLNAFIVSQDAIFIHSGLIERLPGAGALQAVIAHEAAHIANGHIARRMGNLRSARTAATLGLALAVAAAAGGAPEASSAIAVGTAGSAQRVFLSHTRAEEASADQSGLRFMRAAGADPRGLIDVLSIFRGQELLAESRQDPYARSHPLSRDRLRVAEAFAQSTPARDPDPEATYWFARLKGKLTAYQRSAKWTLGRAGDSGFADVEALRRAVAYERLSDFLRAIAEIDRAIAMRPDDPFLHDLKGEILLKSRNFAGATSAFERAARLAPDEPLILAGLGRARLAGGQTQAALDALERARSIDFRDGIMLRDLSVAYAQTGQTGMAALVTAERYALAGRLDDAGIHARRASALLDEGSGPWQRAQDVLIASEREAKERKR